MGYTSVKRRVLGVAPTGLCAALCFSSPVLSSEAPTFDPERLEKHVRYLSSDELVGRGNGTHGLEQAASYLEAAFGSLGLVPAGAEGSYFQSFRVHLDTEVGRHTTASFRKGDLVRVLEYGADFEPMTFSPAGRIASPVVFVGYGVTAPEHDYDDYASVDVEGKIVLVLRYVPGQALGLGPFEKHGWHATFVRKAENAAAHGAAGLILVNGPLHRRDDKLVPFGTDVGSEQLTIPALHVRRDYAEELLRGEGWTLRALQETIDEPVSPKSFELEGVEADVVVDVRRTVVEVDNVLGYLPPSGVVRNVPLSDAGEHIIIGAHYDHVGLGENGSRDGRARGMIHNGADDNSSGVAGMLELARVFSSSSMRPRGILFAAFAGEELGLRGSRYYAKSSTLPVGNAVAMVNLDMIGRLRHDRLYLGGIELLPNLAPAVEGMAKAKGLTFTSRFSAEGGSDHVPFIRMGVPALFFFTGLHGDYHKPTDDLQFINFDGMTRVLELGYEVSDYLLRTDARPTLSLERTFARGSRREIVPQEQAYFGIGLDGSFDGSGVRFSYIAIDGPAAVAGLKVGDVLLALNGRTISSRERASILIRQHRPGEMVEAKVRRQGQILQIKVRLSKWP